MKMESYGLFTHQIAIGCNYRHLYLQKSVVFVTLTTSMERVFAVFKTNGCTVAPCDFLNISGQLRKLFSVKHC